VAEIVTGNGWKTVYSRYRLRARDLAFDAIWIVEVDATAAALTRGRALPLC
jgi:hypothetical protein